MGDEKCRQCHGSGLRTVVRACICPAVRGLPSEGARARLAEDRIDDLRLSICRALADLSAHKDLRGAIVRLSDAIADDDAKSGEA